LEFDIPNIPRWSNGKGTAWSSMPEFSDLAEVKADLTKWMFIFIVGQTAVPDILLVGIVKLLHKITATRRAAFFIL